MGDFNLSDLPPEALEDLKQLLSEKASDLFALCDQEEKGFVTKRDMQRMRAELPLDPDQLEAVFDKLDVDGNGYLTLEEFTDGFGEYLGLECATNAVRARSLQENEELELAMEPAPPSPKQVEEEARLAEEDEFNMMLGELGILGMVEDDTALREMWANLRNGENADPQLVANFEQFLSNLSKDLHKKTTEQEHFENAVRNRSHLQEEQLQRLYEEMEQQIGAERKLSRLEEEKREQRMREEWEATIQMKDQQVAEAMQRMRELQDQLDEARKAVPDIKEENTHLARERDRLQLEVERQKVLQRELTDHLDSLRSKTSQERKARAKAALKVSEDIAQEREGIVNQLEFMRALNSKMIDERDVEVERGGDKDGMGGALGGDRMADFLDSGEEGAKVPAVLGENAEEHDIPDLSGLMAGSKLNGGAPSTGRVGARVRAGAASSASANSLAPPQQNLDLAGTSECEYDDDYFDSSKGGTIAVATAGGTVAGIPKPAERTVYSTSAVSNGSATAASGKARYFRSHSSHDSSSQLDNVSLRDELAVMMNHEDSSLGADVEEEEEEENLERSGTSASKTRKRSKKSLTLLRQDRRQSSSDVNAVVPVGSGRRISMSGNGGGSVVSGPFDEDDSVTSCPGPLSYSSDLTSLNTRSTADPHELAGRGGHFYVTPLSGQAKASVDSSSSMLTPYQPVKMPDRVFKIIFIGDSCVGKTSIITRFCTGEFRKEVKSTVGVDFHTRSVLVDGQSVCLQCWDTAGQERYRSVTRQYFRKSDAVVVVYDVTSEKSFLNARQWVDSAADAVGDDRDGIVFMLLGNKLDVADDDLARQVRKTEGLQLSRSCSTLFWEVSAADGRNLESALLELAQRLREREDLDLQRAIRLTDEKDGDGKGKKKCCGGGGGSKKQEESKK